MRIQLVSIILLSCLSILVKAQPVPPGAPAVNITEIMYDLPGSNESLEFIELRNPSDTNERSLSGYTFTQGIEFSFPFGFIVQPHEFVLVAKDSVAFENAFGVSAFQWFSGDLDDSGETIILKNNFNQVTDSVVYSSSGPWPSAAAGNGASLVLCNDTLPNGGPTNWTAASNNTGIVVNGTEIHANPGMECSVDNAIRETTSELFNLYPNPSTGAFFISTKLPNSLLEVFSATGELVESRQIQHASQGIRIATNLAEGIYLVRLSCGAQSSDRRLVVVR